MAMARCTSSVGAGVSGRMQAGCPPQHMQVRQPAAGRRLAQASLRMNRVPHLALQHHCKRQPSLQRMLARADGSSEGEQQVPDDVADASRDAAEPPSASTSSSGAADSSSTADSSSSAASSSSSTSADAMATTTSSSTEVQQDLFLSPGGAGVGFAVLAAVHAAAGAALALAAPSLAASALNVGWPGGEALALTLLGCCAAALLRSASLCWFLKEGADHGELNTWRYQRANIALLLASCTAAATQLLGWSAAAPPLLAGVLAGAVATAWLSASVALAAYKHGGIVFATGLHCFESMTERLKAAGIYLLRDVSTLAGVLLAFLMCASAWAASQLLLLPPVVSGEVAWAAVLAGATPLPAVVYLQRLVGAGLVVLAAQSLVLLEYAHRVQNVSLDVATKLAILRGLEYERELRFGKQGPARVAPASRFGVLHAGLFASLAVQAFFLLQAGSLGVDVNGDAALWGVQYWSLLVGAVYGLATLTTLDWYALTNAALGLASRAGGVIAMVTSTLYWDWYWSEAQRR